MPLLRKPWGIAAAALVLAIVVLAILWYVLENPSNAFFGATVTQVAVPQKVVALTYDDGPNPPYTNEIVEYLHEQNVPATFFVVGMAVAKYPDVVREEVRYGDALGNHTWDHAHLVWESRRHIIQEIERTNEVIVRITGVHSHIFRPPFGARDFAVIKAAHQLGYQVIMWSVPLPRDWKRPPPALIAKRVLRYVKDGSIIVLHDGNRGRAGNRDKTVEATKLIVTSLRARGFRFVTVPQLLAMGYAAQAQKNPPGPRE